jgi:energy-coupling factor transport system permease protein
MSEALGLYVQGGGWLYRLHPLPKSLMTLWGVLAPFVLPVVALPFLIVGALIAALSSGLGRPYLRGLVLTTLPAVASILLVNAFFFPGARDVLISLGPLAVTREGLDFGVPIAGRIVAAVTVTLAFVTTTRPDDLMEALVQRGAPPKLAFVVLSTIQTVPRMRDKAARILDAQQARGLRTRGSLRARARAVLPLVGPLVIGSLVDVRERSLALEARAFGAGGPRTAYRVVAMRRHDRVLTGLAIVALLALPASVVVLMAFRIG